MISVSFLGAACLSCSSSRDDLHCKAVQVEGGYGYVVLHGADTLIVQPYMPAVGGRKPFTTQMMHWRWESSCAAKLPEGNLRQ